MSRAGAQAIDVVARYCHGAFSEEILERMRCDLAADRAAGALRPQALVRELLRRQQARLFEVVELLARDDAMAADLAAYRERVDAAQTMLEHRGRRRAREAFDDAPVTQRSAALVVSLAEWRAKGRTKGRR